MTRITELDLTVEQDVDVKAARVIKLAKASKKKPTAAASRQQGNNALQIVAAHGYAIVGYRKGVLIQNPHDASIRTIDPKVFHLGFDTIVQAQ